MMTHQSMVFAAGSIAQYLRLGPDERILGLLPSPSTTASTSCS